MAGNSGHRTERAGRLVALLLGVGACTTAATNNGEGSDKTLIALDADALCNRYIVDCKMKDATMDQCLATFGAMRVAPECADVLDAQTCKELLADESSADEVCTPPCSVKGSKTCNDDGTITSCVESESTGALKTYVLDCGAVCKLNDLTWSGVCGTTYKGKTDALAKCWCK